MMVKIIGATLSVSINSINPQKTNQDIGNLKTIWNGNSLRAWACTADTWGLWGKSEQWKHHSSVAGHRTRSSSVMHVKRYGCKMDFEGQASGGISQALRRRMFALFRAAVTRRPCTLSIVKGSQHFRERVRRRGWFRRGTMRPSASQCSLQMAVFFSVTQMADLRCRLTIVAKVSGGSLQP